MNGVDAKHRLSVPAPVRETIAARCASAEADKSTVILSPAEHAPCLIGYDVSYFESLNVQLQQRFASDFGEARATAARAMFGMAEHLKCDTNGRIILTPTLRDMGEIQGQALFLGAGDYFELWAPEVLLEQQGQDPRLIRMVKALMQQKGGRA